MRKTAIILSSIFLLSLLAGPTPVGAEVVSGTVIRWRALTSAPAYFPGKNLVTPLSTVVLTSAVFNKGKAVDISKQNVVWYVNGKLVRSGVGLQEVRLTAPELTKALFEVRVEMPNLGEVNTVRIPVVAPEVVIRNPYPTMSFSDTTLLLKASPFFFTDPSRLKYTWTVNGRSPDSIDDPASLLVNLDPSMSGAKINIDLLVNNPFRNFDGAKRSLQLLFRP